MKLRRFRTFLPVVSAALLVQGCTSSEQKAAAAASTAESALNAGQLSVARRYINQALSERDDVADYWLLRAHIDASMGDGASAFEAYRMLLTLDRGNLEALSALCQIALASNEPGLVEQYADQLAIVQPSDPLPPTVRAAIAMAKGDNRSAAAQLDAVLVNQVDFVPALLLRSKLFIADGKFADGAKLLEASLNSPGDPDSRLNALLDLYTKSNDPENYRNTIVRLADAKPNDADRQIRYADLLYNEGKRDAAYAVVRRVQQLRPDDISVATSILDLWLTHGYVLSNDSIVSDAAGTSLETRATYAQYANELGRPDIAIAILGTGLATGPANESNSDAKAAYAYAIALRGDRGRAMALLNAILAVDPSQPRALVARARVTSDMNAAVQDVLKVVADDETNMVARLTLANLLLRRNETVLAENNLRAGVTTNAGDPRAALRLIRLLRSQGRLESARRVVTDFLRANPFSMRAAELTRAVG